VGLITEINSIFLISDLSFKKKLNKICALLRTKKKHYDWVGFYFANHAEKTLLLETYSGATTEHTTIPFGKGICGQVAISNCIFIAPDITVESNYLSCNPLVKSEIVCPIFVNNTNVGQIDIDSHTKNAFGHNDEILLNKICAIIAKHFPNHISAVER